MVFYVNSYYTHTKPQCLTPNYPCVVLSSDSWDDYTYQTTFRMTFHNNPVESIDFGFIKIFSSQEKSSYKALKKDGKQFEFLNKTYCSLGQNIDYYEKLRNLSGDYGKQILIALRDIAYDTAIKQEFEEYEGIKVSLLRNIGANAALKNGKAIFLNELQAMDSMDFTFTTLLPRASNEHKLHVTFKKNPPCRFA